MAWNKQQTFRNLIILLILSFIFASGAITLLIFNLFKERIEYFISSIIYIIIIIFGNGLGCIWFKICRTKNNYFWHGLIHTVILIAMFVSNIEVIELLVDGYTNECFRKHNLTLLNMFVYIIQYILSFHLMVFRYGRNSSEKAFHSGLHSFGGVLTFFIAFMDAAARWHKISWQVSDDWIFTVPLTFYLSFLFAVCIWYLLLNPYFDLRRLENMDTTKPKYKRPSRRSSKSSVRFSNRP